MVEKEKGERSRPQKAYLVVAEWYVLEKSSSQEAILAARRRHNIF